MSMEDRGSKSSERQVRGEDGKPITNRRQENVFICAFGDGLSCGFVWRRGCIGVGRKGV